MTFVTICNISFNTKIYILLAKDKKERDRSMVSKYFIVFKRLLVYWKGDGVGWKRDDGIEIEMIEMIEMRENLLLRIPNSNGGHSYCLFV